VLRYEFRTLEDSVEAVEQEGSSPTWIWKPTKPGTFRVKVTVEDSAGARVDSGWSSEVVVNAALTKSALIAVLPVENLSGGRAPIKMIAELVRSRFSERGMRILDDEILEAFMKRYRVRNTSGLNALVSKAIEEETGAEAFLITSLETYKDSDPPLVALFARLISSGEQPEILWMDSIGLSGIGYPGLLGLGLQGDPEILLEEAIQCLGDSLEVSLRKAGEAAPMPSSDLYYQCNSRAEVVSLSPEREGKRRHRPRTFFHSPELLAGKKYRVALIPFLNLSDRNNAGNIVSLHFIDQLIHIESFSIVDPGLVREQLLKYRIIMEAGPSLANVDIISSEISLEVDLVFSGTVFDYQDAFGTPKVEFSVKVLDAASRRTVWSSRSQNTGAEGVFFFDVGREFTAHHLASEMAWGTLEALEREAHALYGQRRDAGREEGE
jgi:TolB-like protein